MSSWYIHKAKILWSVEAIVTWKKTTHACEAPDTAVTHNWKSSNTETSVVLIFVIYLLLIKHKPYIHLDALIKNEKYSHLFLILKSLSWSAKSVCEQSAWTQRPSPHYLSEQPIQAKTNNASRHGSVLINDAWLWPLNNSVPLLALWRHPQGYNSSSE